MKRKYLALILLTGMVSLISFADNKSNVKSPRIEKHGSLQFHLSNYNIVEDKESKNEYPTFFSGTLDYTEPAPGEYQFEFSHEEFTAILDMHPDLYELLVNKIKNKESLNTDFRGLIATSASLIQFSKFDDPSTIQLPKPYVRGLVFAVPEPKKVLAGPAKTPTLEALNPSYTPPARSSSSSEEYQTVSPGSTVTRTIQTEYGTVNLTITIGQPTISYRGSSISVGRPTIRIGQPTITVGRPTIRYSNR